MPESKAAPPAVAAARMEQVLLWVICRVDDLPRKNRFVFGADEAPNK